MPNGTHESVPADAHDRALAEQNVRLRRRFAGEVEDLRRRLNEGGDPDLYPEIASAVNDVLDEVIEILAPEIEPEHRISPVSLHDFTGPDRGE